MSIYTPIMQTKGGELTALSLLGIKLVQKITPLLVIHENKQEQGFYDKISKAWRYSRPIYIDAEIFQHQPGEIVIFDEIENKSKIIQIPVTDPYRTENYQRAVRVCSKKSKHGICLRLQAMMLSMHDFTQKLKELTDFHALNYSDIDIVLDLGFISTAPQFITQWVDSAIKNLKSMGNWRRIVFAGTSFPQSSQLQVSANELAEIPRLDLGAWMLLCREQGVRDIDFGDYTCLGLPFTAPTSFMRIAPKIRYATEDRWLYIRGNANKYEQYYSLASEIVNSGAFMGAHFSWGDQIIEERSRGKGGTGNATTWVTIDVNHHITQVLEAI